MTDSDSSSIVRLNIGGKKFCTTVDTLTQREPYSMLAAMFSGRHTVCQDPEKFLKLSEFLQGFVFVDRDGKHFRHILNWLRDGVVPILKDSEYSELQREAEYYQLLNYLVPVIALNYRLLGSFCGALCYAPSVDACGLWTIKCEQSVLAAELSPKLFKFLVGLIEGINAVIINKRKEDEDLTTELTRTDIIKCIQSERVRFRGVNLSGLDLSKLDLSYVDFSYACIRNVFFSRANLQCAKFRDVDAEGAIFHNATLREYGHYLLKELAFLWVLPRSCVELLEFSPPSGPTQRRSICPRLFELRSLAYFSSADACLIDCSFCQADLRSAHLQNADLANANLEGAILEGANLKGAKLSNTNLRGANLQRAYLREVNLRDTHLEGAKLYGANLLGAIRGLYDLQFNKIEDRNAV
ncbi:FH protein interacting protein FIP2 [Morus notabilis]|uniref:FH protein interacting protein FIP2 n=1 Tax=Morus notabilis TaxID=981085 RepID=W9S8Z9_9ROSA|nr:FH protein interacting protein FIP2 [Morus notabilis]